MSNQAHLGADRRLRVSDHALLRFLARAGALEVEVLRASLEASLERAHTAAASVGGGDYLIQAEGLTFVVRNAVVTTVLPHSKSKGASAVTLTGRR